MRDAILLEICVDSVDSALAAQRGGAHRIELCGSLIEGGLTPSAGLMSVVRNRVSIDLYVMIRPRSGDFCYTDDEYEVMQLDVKAAKEIGASGIVFGILDRGGNVDVDRSRRLVEIARPLKVTFHRAFDMSRDLHHSLEDVIHSGVDRVLTSGAEDNVEEGLPALVRLNRASRNRVAVIAGGGITERNIRRIIQETGVREIHASARVPISSPMRHRNEKIAMGNFRGSEYQRVVVAEEKVRRLLAAASDEKHHPCITGPANKRLGGVTLPNRAR
jgi:copper homeostasis protein